MNWVLTIALDDGTGMPLQFVFETKQEAELNLNQLTASVDGFGVINFEDKTFRINRSKITFAGVHNVQHSGTEVLNSSESV